MHHHEKTKKSEVELTTIQLNKVICILEKIKKSGEDVKSSRDMLMKKQSEVFKARKVLTQENIKINGILKQLKTISKKLNELLYKKKKI